MLFKPLSDQNGTKTPSWAARLWFIFVMFGSSLYVWFAVSQHLAIWSLCTLMLSTALLNAGWIAFARISQGRETSLLFESIALNDD